jgi:hypothetical protein
VTSPPSASIQSSYDFLTVADEADRERVSAAAAESGALAHAVDHYLRQVQPLFSRIPISYRYVPIRVRMALLRLLARGSAAVIDVFPRWPIERSVDDAIRAEWREAAAQAGVALREPSYDGRAAAITITHDIDTARDISRIAAMRDLERSFGLASSFGFVPDSSWPTESRVRDLIADGCEVYWHDIKHDGRLPWLTRRAMGSAFDRVVERNPWALETMRAFRSGQLLMTDVLFDVVAERFEVDMSLPDTERFGPYGSAAGCGTVIPFRTRGLLEIPLSMPQDVYLRNVHGLSPDEMIDVWTRKLVYIESVGGVAVLNVHPIWVNPEDRAMWSAYERFLAVVAARISLLATTPVALARLIRKGAASTDGAPARDPS